MQQIEKLQTQLDQQSTNQNDMVEQDVSDYIERIGALEDELDRMVQYQDECEQYRQAQEDLQSEN